MQDPYVWTALSLHMVQQHWICKHKQCTVLFLKVLYGLPCHAQSWNFFKIHARQLARLCLDGEWIAKNASNSSMLVCV